MADAPEPAEDCNESAVVLLPGHACIKQEFIDHSHEPKLAEHLPKDISDQLKKSYRDSNLETADGEPAQKRPKLKGRNKNRPIEKNPEIETKFCPQKLAEKECMFGDRCRFMHDFDEYMAKKSPDLGDRCYVFDTYGYCPYSFACRFASKHITEDGKNLKNEELYEYMKDKKGIKNILDKDVQKKLWKKKYDFSLADSIWKHVKKIQDEAECLTKSKHGKNEQNVNKCQEDDFSSRLSETEVIAEELSSNVQDSACSDTQGANVKPGCDKNSEESDSLDSMKLCTDMFKELNRSTVKKKIDFRDKLYLAPLTTVGNLPFRRICKRFGADVTCSEMALCTNLLQGKQSEWALLKRHESEDIFGAQLCGSFPDTMTRCAQVITSSIDVDFIDINCGCPIDLIFKKGEGCALMGRPGRFETIVRSMTSLMDIPLTVKLRTGIYEDKNIAHNLLPRLRDWGVSMVTLHGRSREQRYTRLADWQYIGECAKIASPMPLFGNGDILSYEDYLLHRKETGIAGAMIARGALIKPWIFTEIKEQRHWDISATERLDILRDFTNFGLDYWGSDQQGVTITRRFLLEWLSFLYRYIPVGLLERLPQRINEKPPYYFGRSDLETMMASPSCADWIKISEMLLGPVPDGFVFLPKHKANAYK